MINGGATQGARSCGGCNGRRWSKVVGGGRRWPEGVVAVGAAKRERERGKSCSAGAGKKKVHEIGTLNKPYGFGC